MIMPIALAKDGFIDVDVLNFNIDNLEGLPFVERDLQFFDGNTCRIINDYNPTNSVFIYENQQGKFLYTITSATPFLHKNNKIWLCNCFEMQDLNKYEKIAESFEKVITSTFDWSRGVYNSLVKEPLKIEIKNNFKPIRKYKLPLIRNATNYFTLKIKCTTNPTIENLETNAPDGSFNFLFPMRLEIPDTEDLVIENFTTKIGVYLSGGGTKIVSLYDIISKYLPNIKSIELLPFLISKIGDESLTFDVNKIENVVAFDETLSGGIFTDCGIFVKTNYSFEYSGLNIDYNKLPSFDAKELIIGGGIKGFFQTPLGNIDLRFNSDFFEELAVGRVLIKEDGWKIDGAFKCEVPPHYLNFYTDSAGQLFIQNLTTNAQELRRLEREKIAKEYEQQEQYVLNEVIKAESFNYKDIFSVDAWVNTAQQSLVNATQNEFNKAKIQREYERSLTEFRDKEKTQSLLASLSGQTLSGQFSLIDFLKNVNNNYFCLYFETNFYKTGYGDFIVQPDYDYSTEIENAGYQYNYDYIQTLITNAVNILLSFRKVAIVENYNNQKEFRFTNKINLFIRNVVSRQI